MNRVWVLLGLLALAGCAPGAGAPADTVERYLTAKVAGDRDMLGALLCSPMEAVLEREAQSFAGVTGVRLEGMVCQHQAGTETVTCAGQIVATYGTEETTFPLTSYRVVQEGGEWKWCGETA